MPTATFHLSFLFVLNYYGKNSDFTQATIIKQKSKVIYNVKLYDKYMIVDYTLNGKELFMFMFMDTLDNVADLYTFNRKVKNHTYTYINR